MQRIEVPATLEWDFASLVEGRHLANWNVGPTGDLWLISRDKPSSFRGSALRHAEKSPIDFHVYHLQHGNMEFIPLEPTHENYWFVQPLPDARFCMVKARANENESNLAIYDASGQKQSAFPVGDGIEDVQTSRDGLIWVSYFDEGVFGDGGPGLNCYNADGNLVFDFDEITSSAPLGGMVDCYALNVASNQETWLCYYTGFPIVCLRGRKLRQFWPPFEQIVGTHAFAVFKDVLLCAGGYNFKNRFFWHELHQEKTVEILPFDAEGEPFQLAEKEFFRSRGRGAKLYFSHDAKIWSLSLQEIWPA